jgi:hypothetical protein
MKWHSAQKNENVINSLKSAVKDRFFMSIDNLSIDFKSNVFYGVSKSIHVLSKEKVIPVLRHQFKLSNSEMAVVGIYFRIHGWLESVSLMNTIACFQGVAAAARSIFELVLDLEMLINDPTGERLKKFNAFPVMDRADAAEKCLNFFKKNKQTPQIFREEHLVGAIVSNKVEVDKNRIELWNQPEHGKVKHWSGVNDIRKRAKGVSQEYENLYIEFYPLLSWSIHPGSTLYGGKSTEALQSYFRFSHGFVIRSSANAIRMVSRVFHLAKVIQSLDIYLNELKDKPYEIMVEESEKLSGKN